MALNHKVENHMLRLFYQILVIIALSGNIIWGQEAGGILSLSQALQTGLKNNLILQQERQRIQQGQAKLQMQKSAYFPRVSANGLYNHLTDFPDVNLPLGSAVGGAEDINIYDFSFKLQQPIFTGFRVKNLVRSAGADLEYNESQYQSNLHLLVYQVANTYRAAQLIQLQQQVLQASLQRVENDLETTRNFYRAGQCSAFDTLTIANQHLNIQTELNEMVHQYQNILTQLEFLLNIKSVQGVENFSAPAADLQTEPLESYLQRALENRPELKQIKHQASSRTFFKKSIESSYWPQVYAQATFHYLKPEVEILKDEWTDFFILGLNLQWDLWDSGKRRNEIKQLSYALDILNLEEQKISESIRSEVKQAYRNLLNDRDQITLTGKLMQQETERYRIAHEKYKQGLATATDLNNVQAALTAAELRQKQSQIKWWQDKALMDYATGQLITSE
jgi:outer membrane protein